MTDVIADFEHKAQDGLLSLKLVNRDGRATVALARMIHPERSLAFWGG